VKHPLKIALQNAPKLPKGSVSPEALEKIIRAETEPRVSLREAMRQQKKS
jgi:hypothetical protein